MAKKQGIKGATALRKAELIEALCNAAEENICLLYTSIKELSVLELNDLVKACEEEFGVSAAAGVVVAARCV